MSRNNSDIRRRSDGQNPGYLPGLSMPLEEMEGMFYNHQQKSLVELSYQLSEDNFIDRINAAIERRRL